MQIVYADVLFLVNFAMDFLTLYLTLRVTARPLRPLRMLLGAAVGGVWGVAALFVPHADLLRPILQGAVALLICRIACGGATVGVTALFWGMGCLLGGGMTAMWSMLNRWQGGHPQGFLPPERKPSGLWLILAALICGLGAMLLGGRARRYHQCECVRLAITWDGRTEDLAGFSDSGSFLTEPISALPVILIPRSEACRLLPPTLAKTLGEDGAATLPTLPRALLGRVRLVPTVSVGGETLLAAVRPDACTVNGRAVEVWIGAADIERAIVPSILTASSARLQKNGRESS